MELLLMLMLMSPPPPPPSPTGRPSAFSGPRKKATRAPCPTKPDRATGRARARGIAARQAKAPLLPLTGIGRARHPGRPSRAPPALGATHRSSISC
jgi:hypothetical protein